MNFNIQIKPQKRVITHFASFSNDPINSTKQNLVDAITTKANKFFVSSKNFTGYADKEQKTVRVFNLEKHRKQVRITKTKKKITRTVIKQAHWVAFVYDIPVDLLKLANLKVKQNNRNFTISKI